ncbi:hypothetical protein FQU76_23460 [Streptomyces qinzhouensis]|uniref:Uncharacterized protein n=1 Tax=Streptomyces qinzhouensis TaxID=2599401 RepID=A0A5B8JC67_9ACTN|nr:hypothetical protein FQU76_23460 [Streptomyces qinzhouensis]
MVGRDIGVTGGLRRHGGNRPLPLHKVMDSGNKGYASWGPRCRPDRPSSCKSHRKPGFIARNGGKQARFAPAWEVTCPTAVRSAGAAESPCVPVRPGLGRGRRPDRGPGCPECLLPDTRTTAADGSNPTSTDVVPGFPEG